MGNRQIQKRETFTISPWKKTSMGKTEYETNEGIETEYCMNDKQTEVGHNASSKKFFLRSTSRN